MGFLCKVLKVFVDLFVSAGGSTFTPFATRREILLGVQNHPRS